MPRPFVDSRVYRVGSLRAELTPSWLPRVMCQTSAQTAIARLALSFCLLLSLLQGVEAQVDFKRGDYNGNGVVGLDDIYIGLFDIPPPVCAGAADANGDGQFQFLIDQTFLLNWIANDGPPPPAPGPYVCGDAGTLACDNYNSCDVVTCSANFTTTTPLGNVPFNATFEAFDFPGATYLWDFGDGTTDTTTVPTVDHEYTAPGEYDVTLTLTYLTCSEVQTRVGIVTAQPTNPGFIRGHVLGGLTVGIPDVLVILNYLFLSGLTPECLSTADVNDDGDVELVDALALLNYLFAGGAPPSGPFPDCGVDPTPDSLVCLSVCP